MVLHNSERSADDTDLKTDYSSLPRSPIWSIELDNALLSNTSSKVKLQKIEDSKKYCLIATADIGAGRFLSPLFSE